MLSYGENKLRNAGIDNFGFEAMQMCLSALTTDNTGFLLYADREISDDQAERYEKMLTERISGEPLQYIIGEWDFLDGTFEVGKGVLIPRPETEELACSVIEKVRKNHFRTVFDLCAGTGCIGISVAEKCPFSDVWLFELYDDALRFTEKNVKRSGLSNIHVIKADVLEGMPREVPRPDFIVSNPPYINSSDIPSLQAEVLREPLTALDGGDDGLVFYKAIASGWLPFLNKNGGAAVECGEGQADAVKKHFSKYLDCGSEKDVFGVERFVSGYVI